MNSDQHMPMLGKILTDHKCNNTLNKNDLCCEVTQIKRQ